MGQLADVTVLVIAKAPAPGRSKTRLCPPLTLAQAAHVTEDLPVLRDVDTIQDAYAVATLIPGSRFGAALRETARDPAPAERNCHLVHD
jgi:glycosyltransferase A (GT-A) superfamily protein (DUF2064 family)